MEKLETCIAEFRCLGKLLKMARTAKNLSPEKAAKKLDISKSYLSQLENGKVPSLRLLRKIANYYNVTATELTILSNPSPYHKKEDYEAIMEKLVFPSD